MRRLDHAFSLVELLVAMSIITTTSILIAEQYRKVKQSIAAVELDSEVDSLTDYVMRATSCNKTLSPYRTLSGAINCAGPITLLNTTGAVIPLSNPAWQMQTECSNSGLVVKVELRRNGIVRKHPITGDVLSFANTSINPLVGRGSRVGLCAANFQASSRARVLTPTLASIGGFTATDCTTVKGQPTWPPSGINDSVGFSQYAAPYQLVFRMHGGCSDFCRLPAQNAKGGYLVDCSAARATCVCFR